LKSKRWTAKTVLCQPYLKIGSRVERGPTISDIFDATHLISADIVLKQDLSSHANTTCLIARKISYVSDKADRQGQRTLKVDWMSKYVTNLLLWLFVLNLGIAFGAGVYEARVVIPKWTNIPPQTWPNTGLLFWVYVTTVPLTLLTLANLIAAWRDHGPRRPWWLGAVAIIVIERLTTFSYFIPTMIRLMDAEALPKRRSGQRYRNGCS
jgi:hypothetical protein